MAVTDEEFYESLATTDIDPLIQKRVDENLFEQNRKYAPLDAALPQVPWNTPTYIFNAHSVMPYAQSTTENGETSPTQSKFAQTPFKMKHLQSQFDIGKFARKTAHQSMPDILDHQLNKHSQSLIWLRDLLHVFGSELATDGGLREQWNGIDRQMDNANKVVPAAGVGNALSLDDLDTAYVAVEGGIAMPLNEMDYFYLMSPSAAAKIDQLHRVDNRSVQQVQMKPRRSDGVGAPVLEVEGGITVPSWRGVPIVRSSYLTPKGTMPAVTATQTGTDALGQSTVATFYFVDAVLQYGPTLAAAVSSITPAGATAHVDLAITAPTIKDNDGVTNIPVLLYRVYKGSSAANSSLYAIVPARDTTDAAVTVIRDLGTNGVLANPGGNQLTADTVGASGALGDGVTFPKTAAGVEDIYLCSRFSDFIVVPMVTPLESEILANTKLRSIQGGVISDLTLAVRGTKYMSRISSAKLN